MILSVEGGVILFFCFFNCVLLSTKRQILSVSSLYTNVFQWSLKINSCLPAQCSYCESIFKDLYDFAALAEIHTATFNLYFCPALFFSWFYHSDCLFKMGNGFRERSLIPVELTLSKSSSIVELNITDILLSPPPFFLFTGTKKRCQIHNIFIVGCLL